NPELNPLSKDSQLIFSSIKSTDSGEFYCTSENKLGKKTSKYVSVNVEYAPKSSSVSVDPPGEIVEGSSVTLICDSDVSGDATYTWYKEGIILYQGSDNWLHFIFVNSEDRGIYYCKSENEYGHITSEPLFFDVLCK
ncbi:hypothetical protein LDENG_00286520, partial [Lucifuga dentata]